MGFQGFLVESKRYMGYGTATPKWRFWLNFPIAAARYYGYVIKDWVHKKTCRTCRS